MKIGAATAALAALTARNALLIAAQSTGQSAFDLVLPVPTSFDESSPASSSSPFDSSCAAYEVCASAELGGHCCPTSQDVFLDCCFGITPVPAPIAEDPSQAPSTGNHTNVTPDASPAPSAVETSSSVPGSSPAPSSAEVISTPTTAPAPATTSPAPVAQAPPPFGAQSIIAMLTPLDYDGCMQVDGSKNDDQVYLMRCDTSAAGQKFLFDGTHMRTLLDMNMCLQAGRSSQPQNGRKMRVFDCDTTEPLQMFHWDHLNGGPLALVGSDSSSYDGICVHFRGVNDNVGNDPIILRSCTVSDFIGMKFGWEAMPLE